MTSANSGSVSEAAGCSELNGSRDTVTICRFATANAMMTTASGTKMIAATTLRTTLPVDRATSVNLRPAG